ncbi:MAG: DUF3419 family protein [Candidatus Rifleibacteriota bacterium]
MSSSAKELAGHSQPENQIRSEVIKADFFKEVGYTTVWEDERIIAEGLNPQKGERVLSITSGGDFSLQCILSGADVISLDFNPRQNFLLEMKKAAALCLEFEEIWRFLGLKPCTNREQLFTRVSQYLSEDAKSYWKAHHEKVCSGIMLSGRQDRYLRLVAKVIKLIQGRESIKKIFSASDLKVQQNIYDKNWNIWLWRCFGSLIFNQQIMNHFFHKDHFRYAQKDEHPALIFRKQTERIFRDVPLKDNFYLFFAFHKTYPGPENCPAWLKKSNFRALQQNIERLSIISGELEQFIFSQPDNSIDCFNFSNIFDWIDENNFVRLMRETARVAKNGARLCYWTNAINTKRDLAILNGKVDEIFEDHELSRVIYATCRTTGYSSCTVGRIKK